ncbi:MAG TPA: M48 family metalloprotease, partial [Terriglobales bacterium]|nr:M48 family metalloprotease [Terriglobales bacterium]
MLAPKTNLRPLRYHEELADYLRQEESETWTWFDSAQSQADYAESLKLELLKQTYRLEAAAYPDLFAALNDAKARLGLAIPVMVYQSQRSRELNAALYFLPGEAHIVFEGDVLKLLDPGELRGVLGHELAHYVLWSESARRFQVVDRIAQAMAGDPRAEVSHVESARLMRLYTEIYADRGALLVTGDPTTVISGLIKLQTGLT